MRWQLLEDVHVSDPVGDRSLSDRQRRDLEKIRRPQLQEDVFNGLVGYRDDRDSMKGYEESIR